MKSATEPNIDPVVARMADVLVERFRPDRVVLFDSVARGEATAESDAVFLVVMPHVERRRELRLSMRQAVSGLGMPKNIAVLSRDEFARKRSVSGTIAHTVDHEGVVLYGE